MTGEEAIAYIHAHGWETRAWAASGSCSAAWETLSGH